MKTKRRSMCPKKRKAWKDAEKKPKPKPPKRWVAEMLKEEYKDFVHEADRRDMTVTELAHMVASRVVTYPYLRRLVKGTLTRNRKGVGPRTASQDRQRYAQKVFDLKPLLTHADVERRVLLLDTKPFKENRSRHLTGVSPRLREDIRKKIRNLSNFYNCKPHILLALLYRVYTEDQRFRNELHIAFVESAKLAAKDKAKEGKIKTEAIIKSLEGLSKEEEHRRIIEQFGN